MLYKFLTLSSLIGYNLAANCCIDAPDESTCDDVDSACLWVANEPEAMAKSSNIPCVSESWYKCEVLGICPPPPPVPPVPSECVFSACDNVVDELNIAFVLDESGSVGSTNYYISLDFVRKMITESINDVSPLSLLSYASRLQSIYTFAEYKNSADGKADALKALNAETFTSGGTATGDAVRRTVDEFMAQTQPHEDNILILMTDGYRNTGQSECAPGLLQDIKDSGITVYVVGITSGFSKSRVLCLVRGNPGIDDGTQTSNDYIITIPKFEKQLFYHIEAQLRRVVCPPDVFKHDDGNLLNNLFVSDEIIIASFEDNTILYMVGLVLLICGGLIYYFRQKICNKKDKYIALNDCQQSQYQSV